jgi:creatinine amidohydrolase
VPELLPTTTSRDEADRAAPIAVLPVGSYEQHGDFLPLATDTLIAALLARGIADAFDLMLLPPVTISCSHEHAAWRGTVSVSARTLHSLITDIASSLQAAGVFRLLIVNGHGGNYVLSNIVQEASVTGPAMALFPTRADLDAARRAAGLLTDSHADMHAGELETSILLHAVPELVRPGFVDADHEVADRQQLLTLGMAGYTTNGVLGRPSLATAEKGKALLDAFTDLARSHIDALLAPPSHPSHTA